MSSIEKAIEIATRAHAGQVDKAGALYVFHPFRLMIAMSGQYERMAAVLHDVVEDTAVTLNDLRAAGFPPEVIDAVDVLTKREGESRLDAEMRASRNPVARVVKMADVEDNMDMRRIADPTEKDYARLKEYEQVRTLLEGKS
jgi:GTP diphosphokinase / guanosine-3',5'-bis(diphosphate) 3'-diphosphatase